MPPPKLREALGYFKPGAGARAPHMAFAAALSAPSPTPGAASTAFVTSPAGANLCVLYDVSSGGVSAAVDEARGALLTVAGVLSAYMRSQAVATGDTSALFDAATWATSLQHVPLWNETIRGTGSDSAGWSGPFHGSAINSMAAVLSDQLGLPDDKALDDWLVATASKARPGSFGAGTHAPVNVLLLVIQDAAAADTVSVVPALGLVSLSGATALTLSWGYGAWQLLSASAGARQQVDAMLARAPQDDVTTAGNFAAFPPNGAAGPNTQPSRS